MAEYEKLSIFFERKFETIQKIKGRFINLFVYILKLYPNFIFVAGIKCKNDVFNHCKEKGIKIVNNFVKLSAKTLFCFDYYGYI